VAGIPPFRACVLGRRDVACYVCTKLQKDTQIYKKRMLLVGEKIKVKPYINPVWKWKLKGRRDAMPGVCTRGGERKSGEET
jgi:hypothetical protein